MKKAIGFLVLLLLAAGWYSLVVSASAAEFTPTATSSTAPSPLPTTTKPAPTCEIKTGFERGTVNLRACGSTSCAVIRVLREGERLTVTAFGTWNAVTTSDGAAGYVNSKFCKGGK